MKRTLWRAGIILPEIIISLGLIAVCLVLLFGWGGELILNQCRVMNGLGVDLERIAGVSWLMTQLKQCSQDPKTWIMHGTEKIVFIKDGMAISFEVSKGRLMRYQRPNLPGNPSTSRFPRQLRVASIEQRGPKKNKDSSSCWCTQLDPVVPVCRRQQRRRAKTATVILHNIERMRCRLWHKNTENKQRNRTRTAQKKKRMTGISLELHMEDGEKIHIDVAFRTGERLW